MIPPDLADEFPATTRGRGAEYFAAGRVMLLRSQDGVWRARVRGSRPYQVLVVPDGAGGLDGSCDCPFFPDHGYCKHVWATVLALDADGALDDEPGFESDFDPRFEPSLDPDFELDDEPMDVYSPANRGGRSRRAGRVARRSRSRQGRGPPPPPPWAQVLHTAGIYMRDGRMEAEPVTWPANRRINYVIDLARAQTAGAVVVELATQAVDAHGAWGPTKRFAYSRAQWLATPDPLDREIARLLTGVRSEWVQPSATPNAYVIDPDAFDPVLRLMCETGRCRVRRDPGEQNPETVAWDDGDPWEVRLRLAVTGSRVTAGAVLHRPSTDDRLVDGAMVLDAGLVIGQGRLARLRHFGAYPLLALLCDGPLEVPRADVPEFLRSLFELPHVPPLEAAPELGIGEVRPTATPRAAIRLEDAPAWQSRPRAPVELSFDYDGVVLPFRSDGPPHFDAEAMRLVHRDHAAERGALDRLQVLGARWQYDYGLNRKLPHLPASKVEGAIDALAREGWQVEVQGQPVRHAVAFEVGVSSGIDWFDLTADIDFGGIQVTLPQLLAGLREGTHRVTLPDGSLGLLPAEWRDRWAALTGLADVAAGGLRFKRTQVALLDALLATMPEVRVDDVFQAARARLQAFDGVRPAAAPRGFIGRLRPYQREGLGWLDFLREFGFGGCLADDMGLGKTIQVLALLEARRHAGAGPSLVVVPRSLITNWMREAARFTPKLRVLDHSGPGRRREAVAPTAFDLMLTTYGVLRREAAALRDVEFEYVILDEAQAIKNAGTASAKAARLLRGRHRLALSGTPVENRLADLWSLFDFLNPGMLSAGLLRSFTAGNGADVGEARRAFLSRALRPFILRRTKAQVAPDLPERLEQTLYVDLAPPQRKLYDELRDHYRASLLGRVDRVGVRRSRIQILEALLRLRQAACHPGLLDAKRAKEGGGKLEVLQARLAEAAAEGHKALVFSQFTSFLALLRARLDAVGVPYEYLDGRTRDRQSRVDRFQTEPSCPAFLISLKAGGLGLNLTAAEYVFLLDPWWNPAVEAQAIDRAHRIGQTRRVFATRLIARDTVEEKVLELQQAKRDLAEAIITENNSVIAKIEREDLEFLLS